MAQASLAANGALKGCLFWEWVAPGSTPSSRGVLDSDPTWQYAFEPFLIFLIFLIFFN